MKPQCPHCGRKFKAWHLAKIHVKYCPCGPDSRVRTRKLGCAFCGKLHNDFTALAKHVRHECMFNPNTKGEMKTMNVGQYVQESEGTRLPLLDPKLFKKLQRKGVVTAKMIACRSIATANFKGLAMDFKNGTVKFAFLARFDRWDITAIAKQVKSTETDDWIGEGIRFIAKKSSKGQTFVNVELPKLKKK